MWRRDHYAGCESPITDEMQLSEYLSDYSAWESSSINLSSDRLEESASVASQVLSRCFLVILILFHLRFKVRDLTFFDIVV
jgi:hypothetical protein